MKQQISRIEGAYYLAIIGSVVAGIDFGWGAMGKYFTFAFILLIDIVSFVLLSKGYQSIFITRTQKQVLIVFVLDQVCALALSIWGKYPVSIELHRILVFILLYGAFYGMSTYGYLSVRAIDRLLKVFIVTGVISFFYDFIINADKYGMLMKSLMYIRYNGGYYSSFFYTRTECAYHAFLCACVCLYFISKTEKKIYYVFYGMFAIHILFTCARMPLAMVGLAALIMFLLDKKLRKNIRWLVLLFIVYIAFHISTVQDFYRGFIIPYLTHKGRGNGTLEIRLQAWRALISKGNLVQLITGYGMGSHTALTTYFDPSFTAQSYHSMIVDDLCQGGIILVVIVMKSVIENVSRVYKSKVEDSFKYFTLTLTIAYIGTMLTDSLGELYDYAKFSTISTALVIGLPRIAAYSANRDGNVIETGQAGD